LIAITLGVAALIVVMAVMEGFQSELRSRIRGSLSDVVIRPHVRRSPASWIATAEADPDVVAAAPRVQTVGMVKARTAYFEVGILAVDPEREARVSDFGKFVAAASRQGARERIRRLFPRTARENVQPAGTALWLEAGRELAAREPADALAYLRDQRAALLQHLQPIYQEEFGYILDGVARSLERAVEHAANAGGALPLPAGPLDPDAPAPALLGTELNWDLAGAGGARSVELLTAKVDAYGGIETNAEPLKLRPAGLFRSGQFQLDRKLVMLPLEAVWDRFVPRHTVSEIALRLREGAAPAEVQARLQAAFPEAEVLTWMDQRKALLRAVRLEKGFLWLVLMLILLAVGFVMLITFYMMVKQKKRDLGLLRALGGTPRGTAAIFVTASLLIGVTGSVTGSLLGWTVAHNINGINDAMGDWAFFPKGLYYMEQIPTVIQAHEVVNFVCWTLGIALLLGGLIPAVAAGRLDPVQALRDE
ncbi:MAG: ABC transporter permease, partial [Planctomycetota bacterium]